MNKQDIKAVLNWEEICLREYARKQFNNKCPYTGKDCETFNCNNCKVEEAEREFMRETEGEEQ